MFPKVSRPSIVFYTVYRAFATEQLLSASRTSLTITINMMNPSVKNTTIMAMLARKTIERDVIVKYITIVTLVNLITNLDVFENVKDSVVKVGVSNSYMNSPE